MQSQHTFSQVPRANVPRSSFNLSHGVKTTFDADYLVPIAAPVDITPSSTFNWRTTFFMRLATPLYPILDNLYFETFAFFVPYRLVWSNFEKFHGSQDDPGDSIDYTIPTNLATAAASNNGLGTLWDYFGLPEVDNELVSILPFRAYNLIYNDWFRDENLQDSLTVGLGDAAETLNNYGLVKRGKRHDYFTSCLPWPQKGTAVDMPLGTSANIFTPAAEGGTPSIYSTAEGEFRYLDAGAALADISATQDATPANFMYADLTTAVAPTINALRLAFQTQRLLERDARAGTRYVEVLQAHWGATSPDHRLQRPEFLGGGSTRINVTPVAQTSGQPTPVADDKLGNLAGFGTASGTHSWSKSFTEHGVVIILGNIRGDITYSQGIDRYWTKSTRYDFVYPVLSQIGEQVVESREIFCDGTGSDENVFGYQERYAEERYISSKLTSLFRVDAAGTLAAWHLSEDFTTRPTLDATFIEAETGTPLDRALAIPTEPHMIADFYHQVKAAKPLPLFGQPGNLDRL